MSKESGKDKAIGAKQFRKENGKEKIQNRTEQNYKWKDKVKEEKKRNQQGSILQV